MAGDSPYAVPPSRLVTRPKTDSGGGAAADRQSQPFTFSNGADIDGLLSEASVLGLPSLPLLCRNVSAPNLRHSSMLRQGEGRRGMLGQGEGRRGMLGQGEGRRGGASRASAPFSTSSKKRVVVITSPHSSPPNVSPKSDDGSAS